MATNWEPAGDTANAAGETVSPTVQIQRLLDRLQEGDDGAREALIKCACARLERLTRKMLRSWERVHRWEQTGDVMQNATLRLYRSLAETRPARPVDFFRLAALHIRRELHDLAKHYYGPQGLGANHATAGWKRADDGDAVAPAYEAVDGEDPANLAAWTEFHDQVGRLPDDERAVFDLLWYQELSQVEAAGLLSISERTLKRRWASARLRLHELLAGVLPDAAGPVPA
jgi:RNA polymerase sigma-70 factor (ECF subfamily)